jgi:hypothetical protein
VITSSESVGWCRKMHRFAGNIGLADGSVQQTSSNNLISLLQNSGVKTTHLAVP